MKFARELTREERRGVAEGLTEEARKLPPAFTREVREEKQARAYAHVYDHYFGAGQSAYGLS